MATAEITNLQLPRRPRFFNGQLLDERDLTSEQEYRRHSLQLHNRMLRPGVVAIDGRDDSLQVIPIGTYEVHVQSGVAIDRYGRQIVNPEDVLINLRSWQGQAVLIVIGYHEHMEQKADYGPQTDLTRWVEQPEIKVVPEASGAPADTIVLARFEMKADGTIATYTDERQYARPHRSSASGWMRLPFLPIPFSGGMEARADFSLLGTRAASSAEGADGCMAIPVPPGATMIKQLRISGRSTSAVHVCLDCISANLAKGRVLDEKIDVLTSAHPPFWVGHPLGEDDALVLTVWAEGESEISLVAAEFD